VGALTWVHTGPIFISASQLFRLHNYFGFTIISASQFFMNQSDSTIYNKELAQMCLS
jgi:hypothetical protein